jgi:prepilin-type N-terminal cleavage/methylation domain-containing protein
MRNVADNQREGTGRRPAGGFSLLEVMVALAILAMSLVVLVGITTDNVRNTQHAKMVTIATFLARAKMSEVEDLVLEEVFTENDQEEEGDFSDEGWPEIRWKTLIEKIELPTEIAQQTQEAAQGAMDEQSDNPLAAMAGFMGGFMSMLIEPIRVGLEESVRRVTVKVSWHEVGRPDRSFEVDTFMTDPAKLDLAVQAVGQPPGGAGGQPPGPPTPGGQPTGNPPAGSPPGGPRPGATPPPRGSTP